MKSVLIYHDLFHQKKFIHSDREDEVLYLIKVLKIYYNLTTLVIWTVKLMRSMSKNAK